MCVCLSAAPGAPRRGGGRGTEVALPGVSLVRGAANTLPAKGTPALATEKVYTWFTNKKECTLLLVAFLFLQFITGIADRARVIHGLGSPWGSQVCNRRKHPMLGSHGQ